ncbi:MAG: T9SS type B sorting domain-containing protein [Bacteroidetes bacterium]|nr:T9SS type B sorting domain-containing protein [Bacteroidota bacterium]
MLRFFTYLVPFFLTLQNSAVKQHLPETTAMTDAPQECGEQILTELRFRQHPEKRQLQLQLDHLAAEAHQKGDSHQKMADYTLPVVFHIIHQNGSENITDTQVLTALNNLNDAYANINYYGGNEGVDTKIQFCLAKRDPNGNATTGINRVVSPLTNSTFDSEIQMKDLIRWNPLEYINIWLVRSIEAGNIAGYAHFPSSHGDPDDGVVMLGSLLPDIGNGHSTLVHEMGHYLGLYHTFEGGCYNVDCLMDGDHVCDTPPDSTTSPPGDCSAIINSCNTDAQSGFMTDQNDINWDYMDYNNKPCRNGFTQGQADRMAFFIENGRESLLNSISCQDPCLSPITANFSASAMTVNIGGTVNFTNTTTGGTDYIWTVNGTQFAVATNPSYTFNSLGNFEIMLDAKNGDPNCSSKKTLTIEVVCPVTASFSTSNVYATPGETVNFTNNSTAANSYAWTVNGTMAGNAANFSNIFSSTGQYNICLEAGNGLCTKQLCQLVFVLEPTTNGDCESSFVRRIGNQGENEESYYMVPDGTGNYFLAGSASSKSLIMRLDPSGNILMQRTYDFTNGNDFISCMMVDDQGFLVGSARDQLNSSNSNVQFKINWQSGGVLWEKQITNPSLVVFNKVYQVPASGNYVFYGYATNAIDEYIAEVNKNTGAVNWQSQSDYGGNTDVLIGNFITNNAIYFSGVARPGSGLDEIRPTLSKFDLNGNRIWTKTHLRSPAQSARLYNLDLLVENDTIVNVGRGSLTDDYTNNFKLLFYKTNLNGNLILAKSYAVGGATNTGGFTIIPIPDGYIVQGTFAEGGTTTQMLITRLNKQGNVIWAKKINTSMPGSALTIPKRGILVDGNFVVFSTQTTQYDSGLNNDLLFGKIALNGQVNNANCPLIEDITLIEQNIPNPYEGTLAPNTFSTAYPYLNVSHSPEDANLPLNDIPSCECTNSNDGCNGSYIESLGESNTTEFTHAILTLPDGNILIGGNHANASLLMLTTPGGEIIWSKTFDFTSGNDFIFEMMLDSDGMLVATGRDQLNTTNNSYLFKFNLQTQTIIWQKLFPVSFARLEVLLEKSTGGNYYVLGMVNDDNMYMEIERNTGNLVAIKEFDYGTTDHFLAGKVYNGAIYTVGVQRNGGLGDIRAAMSKLSLTGTQIWTRFYFNSLSETARTYFYENLIENDSIIAYGRGDLNGSSFTDGEILLMKADLDGNFAWAKRYNIPNSNTEFSGSFIPIPDGYIMQGNHILNSNGQSQFFIIRVDKQGNLIWAKTIKNINGDWGKYAAYQNGFIYFVGRSNQIDASGDIMLGKISLEGEAIGPGCTNLDDLTVTVNNVTNTYDGQHLLTNVNTPYTWSNANLSPVDVQLQTTYFPGCECTETGVDTCANGLPINTTPDAFLQNISAQCNGDSMLVNFEVCNADSVALPQGTPISFYQNNPTNTNASLLATIQLDKQVLPGTCEQFTLSVPLPPNQQIFAVVNDDGTTPTPFDLATDFPNTTTQECDFTNNIASFTVNYTPPVLELGPDISACDFSVTELDAGSGFASYLWYDNSTEQTLTAWQPGTYSVTVTDLCGGTQTDEITFSTIPSTVLEIGMDTLSVCEGDSATLTVSGFSGYQWFPADLVDCPTCPSITVTNPVDTCLILVATDGNGCYSTDTVCLKTIQAVSTTDTMQFCQGDTVIIFGNPVTSAGDYSMVFASQNGCDSTTTITLVAATDTVQIMEQATICMGMSYDFFGMQLTTTGQYDHVDISGTCPVNNQLILSVLDTFFISENITICEGDTAIIFGNPVTSPGVFSMVFASQNTCDSTHQITLTVLDSVLVSETIIICENETADIFGTPTNAPGIYSQTFAMTNGCDSTVVIELVVHDTFSINQNINICQGDSVLIFGNWETQSGIFNQNLSTANGCDSTVTINLTVSPTFQTAESISICEGQNADIFGTLTSIPGTYSMTFPSQNGCDSTHTIDLMVLDSVLTSETIIICETETANIFGTQTNQPGTYSEIYPLPGGCDSTHVIELVVNDTALVLQNLSICAGDSILIFGNWESQPGIFTQTIAAQNGCDSTTVANLSVGQSFQINFEKETACPLLFDGSVTAIPNGGMPPYIFNWENDTVFTNQLTHLDVGTYYVTVTDQSGCAVVDSVTLGAAMRPEVTSEVENASCFGVNDGTLTIVADDPTLQFSMQGSPISSQVFYDSIFAGSYQYFVVDTFGCIWEEVYFITAPNKIVLQLPNSIEAPMCDSVQLNASSTTSPLTWSWSPPDFLSCTDCPDPIASPFMTTTYYLMVTDSNGCKALDSIVVNVDFEGKAYIPNAFSPNGDGINDVFYVLGRCVKEVKILRIFDRWGEMVFEKSNTPPNDPLYGWNGKFRGKDMNSDVFVYYVVVELADGNTSELKGDVTLMR